MRKSWTMKNFGHHQSTTLFLGSLLSGIINKQTECRRRRRRRRRGMERGDLLDGPLIEFSRDRLKEIVFALAQCRPCIRQKSLSQSAVARPTHNRDHVSGSVAAKIRQQNKEMPRCLRRIGEITSDGCGSNATVLGQWAATTCREAWRLIKLNDTLPTYTNDRDSGFLRHPTVGDRLGPVIAE